ncbi:secreted RxLR effector peptide protein, putative [Phytophthora infestans T30-4]
MRASLLLLLVAATIAISLTAATNGLNPARRLKGVQTSSVEEEPLRAQDEERAGWADLASKFKAGQLDDALEKMKGVGQVDDALAKIKGAGQLDDAVAAAGGNKWQQALEKLKAQKALQNAEKVAETTTAGKNKWQSALEKLKANNFKNIDDIKIPVADQNKWQAAVAKIQAGKLTNLDTTNNKWQSAFQKLKASGQLKNVDEAQVAKLTEGVANEIAKNPEKSSKFGKIMTVVFGAAITGLVVYGISAMVTS